MDNFIDDRFIKTAEDAKISWILPSIGLAMGLGNHILQRGNLDPEDRMRHLLRSTLLGGMAGAGAEMMRVGTTNFINRFGDNNQIPKGTEGFLVPKLNWWRNPVFKPEDFDPPKPKAVPTPITTSPWFPMIYPC